ncbi:hypothetical protein [Micromonospora wenchangensis]|uniref:hypothetical protein n=1 Tax=Micromonospora wenchangensis TaxID=1185415 RepID=UPI003D73AFC8
MAPAVAALEAPARGWWPLRRLVVLRHHLTNRPTFPPPLDTVASGKVRVWDRAAVDAWIRQYRPNQPRGADDDER